MFAMALPMEDGWAIDVGDLVATALRVVGMSHKEACWVTGYDAASFCRALQGAPGYSLDLWKLSRLPWRFQSVFWPLYVSALARVVMEDITNDVASFGKR
jgi:hypothetical protein